MKTRTAPRKGGESTQDAAILATLRELFRPAPIIEGWKTADGSIYAVCQISTSLYGIYAFVRDGRKLLNVWSCRTMELVHDHFNVALNPRMSRQKALA